MADPVSRRCKRKPCNFEASLCGSLYSTCTTSFYSYADYNKRLQALFKDQLDRYKATCSLQLTNYLDIDFPFSYKQILLDVGKLFYFFYVRREAEVFEGCDVIKVNYPGCFVHLKKLGKRILSVYKFAQ